MGKSIRLVVLKLQTIGEIIISSDIVYIRSITFSVKAENVYKKEIFGSCKVRKPRDRVLRTITIERPQN